MDDDFGDDEDFGLDSFGMLPHAKRPLQGLPTL